MVLFTQRASLVDPPAARRGGGWLGYFVAGLAGAGAVWGAMAAGLV